MTRLLTIASLAAILAGGSALADVNEAVKNACRNDYHKHCDNLAVGSDELRACMRGKATELSKECLTALVEHKEVTQEDIDNYIKEMDAKAN
ncbi:hypothetical protein [Hyphomicrobium sp. CS1GBMeth3]|uniref:hypothetical protein n=1 Tax=Hyphomicrobium sp. CS1GBMeth3 TaxID=1892845 RepID=UPI0009315EEC|nr:hypothetical protein [Hyphomicrobium sp. CS1GBMeth3]